MTSEVYHIGQLAHDRLRDDTVNVKATEEMEQWRAGRVHLVQRVVRVQRNAAGNVVRPFEYLVIGRSK